VGAVLGGACGGATGTDFRCDRANLPFHSCDEYDDLSSADLAGQQANCTRTLETAVTACPTAALLGTCALPRGSIVTRILMYSDVGGETAAKAAMFCAQGGGTWTPV
jgi:hypothetical protein